MQSAKSVTGLFDELRWHGATLLVDMNARIDRAFWKGRRVFLTGHTGFKGAWMSLVLRCLGADVTGYALPPQAEADLFRVTRVENDLSHQIGDVRDFDRMAASLAEAAPDIVIHMAAQALVRPSYEAPLDTYAINVMGTVNLLEAARRIADISAVVVVTSDKCYESREWIWGYREGEALGGRDPYSSSKACAELVTASYRDSFFTGRCRVASGRAGNVVGGGDWSRDRLVPDAIRAFTRGEALRIRNPKSIRPWQHVLEPVSAYLFLAQRLVAPDGYQMAEGWNFGPLPSSEISVGEIVERLVSLWGESAVWEADPGPHPHEASFLKLDCAKARHRLGWTPVTDVDDALSETIAWYKAQHNGADMRQFTLAQIDAFLERRCA